MLVNHLWKNVLLREHFTNNFVFFLHLHVKVFTVRVTGDDIWSW